MELLRACYFSFHRFFDKDGNGQGAQGFWYWCKEDVKPVPFAHVFGSSNWWSVKEDYGTVGEFYAGPNLHFNGDWFDCPYEGRSWKGELECWQEGKWEPPLCTVASVTSCCFDASYCCDYREQADTLYAIVTAVRGSDIRAAWFPGLVLKLQRNPMNPSGPYFFVDDPETTGEGGSYFDLQCVGFKWTIRSGPTAMYHESTFQTHTPSIVIKFDNFQPYPGIPELGGAGIDMFVDLNIVDRPGRRPVRSSSPPPFTFLPPGILPPLILPPFIV